MIEDSKKRALIITYYWPPSGGSGVQRWLKFTKYFRDYGWEPVIYTPSNPERPATDNSLCDDIPEGVEVLKRPIWEPYHIYKKIVGVNKDQKLGPSMMKSGNERSFFHNVAMWIRGNLFIPDARKFWIKPSVRYLKKVLNHHEFDAIITTGPPHSMHMIGMEVSKKTGIPWLADFRDPWTNIDFFQDLQLSDYASKKHHKLEKKVLDQANRVVVISNTMKSEFEAITETPVKVITNGFDHEDFQEVNYSPSAKCTVSHIGMMSHSRNPEILWRSLAELSKEIAGFKDHFCLQLVGRIDGSIRESISEYKLQEIVNYKDYVPHDEITSLQQDSEALLLIINNSPNAPLLLTGKLFEYLAAKRPIVCITPMRGDASELLENTSPSSTVHLYQDLHSLKAQFKKIYEAWKSKENLFIESKSDQFSRKNLTDKMTQELDQLL